MSNSEAVNFRGFAFEAPAQENKSESIVLALTKWYLKKFSHDTMPRPRPVLSKYLCPSKSFAIILTLEQNLAPNTICEPISKTKPSITTC